MNYPIISLNKMEGAGTLYELTISLPDTFDLADEILGISIMCPLIATNSITGMTNNLGLIETTEGFVGIQLTNEQKDLLHSVFEDSTSVLLTKSVEYPDIIPTADDKTLLSYSVVGYV